MRVIRKAELARQVIKDACLTCKGYGCKDCSLKIEHINGLVRAAIPNEYWNYSLDTFNGHPTFIETIVKYSKNIDKLYVDGTSLMFSGKFGVGKTFGAIYLLKAAINSSYSSRYTTMNEIIEMAISKAEEKFAFRQTLLNIDFCVIDEVSTRFISSSSNAQELFGSNLEYIIRTRFQNKLPTIICTNDLDTKDIFGGAFEEVFSSIFSHNNLVIVPVAGQDLRKQ